ncbi:MAG: hypothetical protein JXX14_23395 [Deltaproteobacteria bacterium]|nr:hypothetical protein [Deltaproteobacteria bacterium]
MTSEYCSDSENVVRAICTAHYDDAKKRINSSLFRGNGISVSRLSVLSKEEIINIFRKQLVKPNSRLLAICTLNTGDLKKTGKEDPQNIFDLSVEIKPEPDNPAHAEIISDREITKGLSKRIIERVQNAVEELTDE